MIANREADDATTVMVVRRAGAGAGTGRADRAGRRGLAPEDRAVSGRGG